MSEQGKHTPGPWRVDHLEINGEVVVRDDDDVAYICMVFCGNKEQDARLIAAAPDLLEALKQARECIAYCRRAHKDAQSGEGFPIETFLDAAIAKAEGQSQ